MFNDLESMRIDELWELYETIAQALREKLLVKKSELDGRLRQLNQPTTTPNKQQGAARIHPSPRNSKTRLSRIKHRPAAESCRDG